VRRGDLGADRDELLLVGGGGEDREHTPGEAAGASARQIDVPFPTPGREVGGVLAG
jgi:hypothetical protein